MTTLTTVVAIAVIAVAVFGLLFLYHPGLGFVTLAVAGLWVALSVTGTPYRAAIELVALVVGLAVAVGNYVITMVMSKKFAEVRA